MKKINVSVEVEVLSILLEKKAKETTRKRNTIRNAHVNYIRKQPMKLLDISTGLMQCKVCGSTHFALVWRTFTNKIGDRITNYKRGAWQCQNGCKI
jgi:hypothetical protein